MTLSGNQLFTKTSSAKDCPGRRGDPSVPGLGPTSSKQRRGTEAQREVGVGRGHTGRLGQLEGRQAPQASSAFRKNIQWRKDSLFNENLPQYRRPGFDPWVGKIPLEKEMATHSSILAWRIPGKEEPGGLPSMGSHRVRHD